MTQTHDTYAAVMTPPGASAVATITLVGPRALSVARTAFRPAAAPLPDSPPLNRIWYGQFGGPPGDAVILTVRRTHPVPWVEIHCHGGSEVVRWLTQTLEAHDVRLGPWESVIALMAETPLRARAAAALTCTPTGRTAGIILDQWRGALEQALGLIDRELAEGNRTRLSELLRYAPVGRHLTRPWRVVVAGAPNVGKSSLVNALAGFQRGVVTPVPGTTRDVVTTLTAIDGWPVELFDTAGQHPAGDALEAEGIARAREAIATADLTLWVLDSTGPPVWPDGTLPNVLWVLNKSDRPAVWGGTTLGDGVAVSAQTRAGIDELSARISGRLVPEPPPPGAAVPFAPDIADQLEAAAAESSPAAARPWIAALLSHPAKPPDPV
jgi:tRNA modification GTPase